MGARSQPLTTVITTAGFNKLSPCYDLRKTAIDVLRGVLHNDSFLVNIHALDDKDDWEDEKMWRKSNPNLGASVNVDVLRDLYKQAHTERGQKEVDFKTKNLNIWTDSSAVFIPDRIWKKNSHGIEAQSLIGKTCYGGLDLASVSDINAYLLLFPEVFEVKNKKISAILPYFYMPEDNLDEKSKQSRVDFRKWVEAGYIKLTPGNITDYDFIEKDIVEMSKVYDFRSLAFDPWNAGNLIGDLSNQGIECHELRQSFAGLTNATKQLERMALSCTLEHFNNPVLRWMLGNVELKTDPGGNIKPDKAKSTGKIDGVSALVDAIADWMAYKDSNQYAGIHGIIEGSFFESFKEMWPDQEF
jgi:phage terminase large subunit-like protein